LWNAKGAEKGGEREKPILLNSRETTLPMGRYYKKMVSSDAAANQKQKKRSKKDERWEKESKGAGGKGNRQGQSQKKKLVRRATDRLRQYRGWVQEGKVD